METTLYEESGVPVYRLPELLVSSDGARITTPEQWKDRRRELLGLLSKFQYGHAPESRVTVTGKVHSVSDKALSGRASLKQLDLVLEKDGRSQALQLLLFIPEGNTHPVPAFLGLNFYGNHTIHPDPRIRLHKSWSGNNRGLHVSNNRACEESRGRRAYRWPVEKIVARGYALVAVYCGDIDPDYDDGFSNGVHGLFATDDFTVPAEEQWGTIAAWSWGLSRILDHLIESEPRINPEQVIAVGHSRMGKAALWAAAQDERFAAAVSNESGCAGAAIHRRRFGERLLNLNTTFPHWLNQRAKHFNEREHELPFDQHALISLIAPRPIHVASAAEDLWADPKGEFLSLVHADPVYRLLGTAGLASHRMPTPGSSITGPMSYHIRHGKHDMLEEDWSRFLEFADLAVPRIVDKP